MKKLRLLLLFSALLARIDLQAQNTGDAAVSTAKTAKSNSWQNWAFAATALVTAAGAIFFVSINDGKSVSNTTTSH